MTDALARLNRSQLSVPGGTPKLFEKAARSAADIVVLDLEDAVPVEGKAAARALTIEAIDQIDWGHRGLSVRINAADTPFQYRDLIDILERAGERLDLIMLPKVSSVAEVQAADILIGQIERAMGRQKPVGLELLIETPQGVAHLEAIAAASPRIEALHFGMGDFAAATGARTVGIGEPNPAYGVLVDDPTAPDGRRFHAGDMWHYALARLVVAARAHGLRPIDGPYANFRDGAGLAAQAARSAALGCEGKWAIHPDQIAPLNAAFAPTESEIAQARRVLAALEEARADGRAAVQLDGRMIDIASIRQAEATVAKADLIARTAE